MPKIYINLFYENMAAFLSTSLGGLLYDLVGFGNAALVLGACNFLMVS